MDRQQTPILAHNLTLQLYPLPWPSQRGSETANQHSIGGQTNMSTRVMKAEGRTGVGWAVGRGGLCVIVFLQTWAIFEPLSFITFVLPITKVLGAGSLATAGGIWWYGHRKREPRPTWEDWACGIYITGLPGSGKTAYAYQLVREFCRRDWGFIWLSIKSSLPLLEYLPAEARERTLLFAPASESPKGINFLRTYTGTSTERELIADQTAELFDRLHSAMSGNMRELIRMGTLALLGWAQQTETEITLWELYRMFQSEAFRSQVLARASKPIRDAFSSDEVRKTTLQAVKAQLRRSVTSENLLVALSQTGGIDLWDVIQHERWLVCETPEAELGPAVASFLCQVIASRVQMLTSRRKPGSRPFMCAADEFQEYSNPSFAKGIATGREFGLAWVLIHQSRSNQSIGKEVAGAVHLCGSRWYFQQAPEDARAAVEATERQWEAEVFTHLPKRHFRALRRMHGYPVVLAGVTPDLPARDPDTAEAIIQRNSAGPSRTQILRGIESRKVGSDKQAEEAIWDDDDTEMAMDDGSSAGGAGPGGDRDTSGGHRAERHEDRQPGGKSDPLDGQEGPPRRRKGSAKAGRRSKGSDG